MNAMIPIKEERPETDELFETAFEMLSDKTDSEEDSSVSISTGLKVPRVFKCDIRWTYMNMFVNSLNSGDIFLAYSFLKTFTRPDFVHVVRPAALHPTSRGAISFMKNHVYSTLLAPDMVIRPTNVAVRNLPGGRSVVTASLFVTRTYLYEKPTEIDDCGDCSDADILEERGEVGSKRKVLMSWATPNEKTNLKAMGLETTGKLKNFERTRRIRASRYSADLGDRECEFLSLLDAAEPGRPKPLSEVMTVRITGTQTMTLDAEKRIVAFDFTMQDQKFEPIEM